MIALCASLAGSGLLSQLSSPIPVTESSASASIDFGESQIGSTLKMSVAGHRRPLNIRQETLQ